MIDGLPFEFVILFDVWNMPPQQQLKLPFPQFACLPICKWWDTGREVERGKTKNKKQNKTTTTTTKNTPPYVYDIIVTSSISSGRCTSVVCSVQSCFMFSHQNKRYTRNQGGKTMKKQSGVLSVVISMIAHVCCLRYYIYSLIMMFVYRLLCFVEISHSAWCFYLPHTHQCTFPLILHHGSVIFPKNFACTCLPPQVLPMVFAW